MPECKADIYYRDKLSGLSIAEIARKHGVSKQAVSQAISNKYGKRRTPRFRKWTEEKCIYGNLRKWLNDNEIGITKLMIMLSRDDSYSPGYASKMYDLLAGKRNPSKRSIDRLLQITGMTYEEMFSTEVTPGKDGSATNEVMTDRRDVITPVSVQAHWLVSSYTSGKRRYKVHACSRCGYRNGNRTTNYCPNCGAHMDEEVAE